MSERFLAQVLNPGQWLLYSLGTAVVAAAILLKCRHRAGRLDRETWAAAMHLHAGLLVGGMATGHLVAVTVKLLRWGVAGSVPLLYLIGVALLAPSAMLVVHARRLLARPEARPRQTIVLNLWQILTLVALGISNLPLAVPALLNIAYAYHTRPVTGRALAGLLLVFSVALLAGFVVFLRSGQTFMQFSGSN
jgi:hypothetical protein